MKIQIKNRFTGSIIFEHKEENNSIKMTVELAVKNKISLDGASLDGASLNYASLNGASLDGASLNYASLNGASLNGASLNYASLNGASLNGASLDGASLDGAKINELTFGFVINCPEIGLFTAFKKASGKIVKLLIPEDSKRSSATTFKCRCSKATILTIENLDGSDSGLIKISSSYDSSFVYEVGKTVEVEKFDENRWNECSTGIHFFMSREMARKYN